MVYNNTPMRNGRAGITGGGGFGGRTVNGHTDFTTSNGNFDANTGRPRLRRYGLEKPEFRRNRRRLLYPHDQQNMSNNNLDLGAGGPVLLVDQTTGSYPHLLITAGKTGTIYVVNRDNMGGYNPNNDNQIVQSLVGALANGDQEVGNYSTPVYFNGWVYFAAVNDYIKAFQLSNGLLSTSPTSISKRLTLAVADRLASRPMAPTTGYCGPCRTWEIQVTTQQLRACSTPDSTRPTLPTNCTTQTKM